MDRFAAMLILLTVLVGLVLMCLAFFAYAPIFSSCIISLLYTLYLFLAYEEHGVHHAQEFENRFWTLMALLFSTALFFARDSPIAVGRWSPSLGFCGVILSGFAMHAWDRHVHRVAISRQLSMSLRRNNTATSSLNRLKALGIPVEDQLERINASLKDIDQLLLPSTINNFINLRFVLGKEREIISVFEECDARALNYLISHAKLGLLFYKIKDHRNFGGQNRTRFIQLLAVDRLPALTVMSRVIVLHALQLMKLRANPRAEAWVLNVIQNTHQDDLSELKTLTDAKGDYFCMKKLIYDDIRSDSVRNDILNHIRREAAVHQAHIQMGTIRAKKRLGKSAWRKVLSDVDDTLSCSGGSYPAGIDKRYGKKVVYPGVLAFYRELDLGTHGPEEWPDTRVGNLVFLSARPHVYKDVSEKINFAKFEKLRVDSDGRKRMHTVPSLLAGDIASGTEYMMTNDMEPLALKKLDNFQRYVSIYPEYRHIFVCDNGQGDVRAGEMMFDANPYEFEALYVHVVQDISRTHGFAPEKWRKKGLIPCFFRTYPEAALNAATRSPPLIRLTGLRRICVDTVKDFKLIQPRQWPSYRHRIERRAELNQAIWRANELLQKHNLDPTPYIEADPYFRVGQKVRTPYGIAIVRSFDKVLDLYEVQLDWRPLSEQVKEHAAEEKRRQMSRPRPVPQSEQSQSALETVVETEETDDEPALSPPPPSEQDQSVDTVTTSDDNPTGLAESAEDTTFTDGAHEPDTASRADSATTESSGSTSEKGGQAEPPMESITADGPRPGFVFAKVHSRYMTKYVPPVLPKVEKDRGTLFSFWAPTSEQSKKRIFKSGEQCSTPYGPAVVQEHRMKTEFVVVKMMGWNATAYISEQDIKPISKSLLASFLGRFGSGEQAPASKPVPAEFPYAEGTLIKTPFGDAKVTKPLSFKAGRSPKDIALRTIGLSLLNWKLADQTHAVLYCTVGTAKKWKEGKSRSSAAPGHLLSAFGNLMSKTFRSTRSLPVERKPESLAPRHEQYYKDGAAVTTDFGDGVVRRFRENDGFYEVSLVAWKLANGSFASAILQRNDIQHRIASGCIDGLPVMTRLGLSGTLASVEPTTGVHIVTVPSAGIVCYLQPTEIVCPLKAAVGEEVSTPYGEGRVERYRQEDSMYIIKLNGWGGRLYTKAETFDRLGDGINDTDYPFGMKWLLSLFSFTSEQPGPASTRDGTRSRSNSIVGLGGRSVGGRSTS